MFKILLLLSMFFSINCAFADIDKDKNEIQLAIRDVLRIEGDASAADSVRFWARLPKGEETQKALNMLIDEFLTPTNKVQHQMWTCIRQSWIEKTKNKCDEAIKFILSTEKKLGADNFDAKKIMRNLNKLTEAASSNLSSSEIEGVRYDLSLEVIEKTIARIDKATQNFKFFIENKK